MSVAIAAAVKPLLLMALLAIAAGGRYLVERYVPEGKAKRIMLMRR